MTNLLFKTIAILTLLYIIYLAAEAFLAARYRHIIKHIIYVNGTRGKSSVTRLIDAGLRQHGYKVFCKTTGTLPMTIDVDNVEKEIKRRGKANIKEQLYILKMAAKQHAEILVIECMAVQPQLQYISQHKMLKCDIGVITNARLDHLDVMGSTVQEIGESLCNTVPKNGVCFTADRVLYDIMEQYAKKQNTKAVLCSTERQFSNFDFEENLAIALDVCKFLNIDEETALEGMKNYKKDPYALSLYKLKSGATFIGGLAINDPQSCINVWQMLNEKYNFSEKKLTMLISNRGDRGYRTLQHIELCEQLKPHQVLIVGSNSRLMANRINKKTSTLVAAALDTVDKNTFEKFCEDDIIYAVGNIGEKGRQIMNVAESEGVKYV